MSKHYPKADPKSVESAYELFGLAPDIKLSKKEKKILRAIYEYDNMDFYSLCEWFDMRPSKMDKWLDDLSVCGLVEFIDTDDALVIVPTPIGERYCGTSKAEKRADKELKKFIDKLNDKELAEFCDTCVDVFYEDGEDISLDDEDKDIEVEIFEDTSEEETDSKKKEAKKSASKKADNKSK